MGMERHRLIAVRLKKHWAQAEAARRIGVNAATLCRWEQGRSMPNLYNIQQLCKAYDVSSAELDLDPSDNVIETPTTKSIDDLNEIQAFIQQDLTMRLIALAYENLCDSQTLQDTMAATLEEHTAMQPKALITRREALSPNRLRMPPSFMWGRNEPSF